MSNFVFSISVIFWCSTSLKFHVQWDYNLPNWWHFFQLRFWLNFTSLVFFPPHRSPSTAKSTVRKKSRLRQHQQQKWDWKINKCIYIKIVSGTFKKIFFCSYFHSEEKERARVSWVWEDRQNFNLIQLKWERDVVEQSTEDSIGEDFLKSYFALVVTARSTEERYDTVGFSRYN